MGGEVGRVRGLPLLPAGSSLFTNLPAPALVLDALAPALGDGIISVIDGERTAVLVVRDGAIADVVGIVGGDQQNGAAALALLRSWGSASVSCSGLTSDAMSLLGPLLHGEPVYNDLHLAWTAWSQLLDDLRTRGQTFVVELQTPAERGVTVIRGGEQVATYSESHPSLGRPDLLDTLAAGGDGAVRVLAESAPPGALELQTAISPALTETITAPPRRTAPHEHLTPAFASTADDDATATFSALFGAQPHAQALAPVVVVDRSRATASAGVASLVPELKLLARRRLQRSSAPVEDAVDAAAEANQSIEWLSDRVRAMRVRGFMATTFEQLADDMLALARRT